MKKLLYALIAVVLFAVAAVLLLPSVIDWNAYKDQLAGQVERATGRDIAVEGPVSLSLLPSPAFSAERVTLANIEGGSRPAMAEVADLRVKVALAPLLQGRVQVDQIVMVEPDVVLERTAEGRVNWALGLDRLGDVRLESVRVVDGVLRYRDAVAGIDQRLARITAELSAQSLTGPFEAAGSLSARGVPLTFDGRLGRLDAQGPAPYSLRLALAEGDASANLGGALETGQTQRLSGDLELRGGDLAATLARLTGGRAGAYPVQLAQNFSADSKITVQDGELKAQGLSLQLGDTGADGHLRVGFAEEIDAAADLTVQRLDLDRWLAMAGDGRRDAGGESAGDAAGGEGAGGFALPEDVRAELNVNVGAIVYRDRVIRQGRANAVLDDGTVTLNQAMALLPGSSDVALFGTLAARDGKPVFDGRLESASDNLRVMFDWLGVAVDGVPEDRLRRMSLLADLQARPSQVTLTNIGLDVDTAQVKGGIAIALRKRPGFGIGLSADKLNLDAYLPAPGAGDGADTDGSDGADGGMPPLGWLGGFDANFDLHVGQLTYAGQSLRDVQFDATLHNQALTVRNASIADLAGTRVAVDGTLTELIGLDPKLDLNLDLDVGAPGRLAGLFGHGDAVPAELGPVALVATAQGPLADTNVDGTLRAVGGTATFQGRVQPWAAPAAFDLVLGLQHDSLQALAANAPGLPALAADPGGLDLASRVSGTVQRFGTDTLKGTIGPVKLNGPLEVDLTGPRPKLTAQLETGELPVQAFALAGGDAGGAGDGDAAAGGDGQDAGEDGGSGTRWPSQPLALGGLRALDLDLTLASEALRVSPRTALEKARLAATLKDGVLDLERLEGGLFDGRLAARGTLDARDRAAATLRLDLEEVNAGPLLTRGLGFGAVEGRVTLQAELDAQGNSPRQLVESLNGQGQLDGRVTVAPRVFLGPEAGQVLGDGEGGQLGQQLAEMLGEQFGTQVQIQGLTQALDFAGTTFTQRPAKLSGTFAAEKGVIRTEDLTLDGLDGRAETAGTVNLPSWRIDATTELFRAKDAPDAPFVVTRQRGPLDAPNVAVTGGAFRQKVSPEAAGDGGPGADGDGDDTAAPNGGTEDGAAQREGQADVADDGQASGDAAGTGDANGVADSGGGEAGATDGNGDRNGDANADADAEGGDPKRAEDIIRGVLDQLQQNQ